MSQPIVLQRMATLYVLDEGHNAPKAKFGKTDGMLWERLRVLNQGNWRELKFSALWVGPVHLVKSFEATFKASHKALGGGGLSEWFNYTPKELEAIVDSLVQAPIFKVTDPNLVPYGARKGSVCPIDSYHGMYHTLVDQNNFDYLSFYADNIDGHTYNHSDWKLGKDHILSEGRTFEFR